MIQKFNIRKQIAVNVYFVIMSLQFYYKLALIFDFQKKFSIKTFF